MCFLPFRLCALSTLYFPRVNKKMLKVSLTGGQKVAFEGAVELRNEQKRVFFSNRLCRHEWFLQKEDYAPTSTVSNPPGSIVC